MVSFGGDSNKQSTKVFSQIHKFSFLKVSHYTIISGSTCTYDIVKHDSVCRGERPVGIVMFYCYTSHRVLSPTYVALIYSKH